MALAPQLAAVEELPADGLAVDFETVISTRRCIERNSFRCAGRSVRSGAVMKVMK